VQALVAQPRVRLLSEEEGFLEVYLVPDAHLAALLQQHGVETLYGALLLVERGHRVEAGRSARGDEARA
jgi:hypothetical protein